MRKKLLRSRSGFEKPESREEAIMQNILGASNVLEPSESNIEEILKSILYNTPYTEEAEFEIEKILLAIKNNGTYDGECESRDLKILFAILNDLDYTEEAESRIEELFIEWLNQRSKIKVLEGIPPLTFVAKGEPLINYEISGNTTQNGTPTPDNPIMPEGTGERTRNLCNSTPYKLGYSISATGVENANSEFNILSAKVLSNTQYRLSFSYPENVRLRMVRIHEYSNGAWQSQLVALTCESFPYTFTTNSNIDEVRISIVNTTSEHMINTGSTPLSYEPYGFEISISSARQTTPVYLGEVQSTRRIYKLVLTGQENWKLQSINSYGIANLWITLPKNYVNQQSGLSSHFTLQTTVIADTKTEGFYLTSGDVLYIRINATSASTANELKSYLADQYAAGTPVTVWYVLAESETGIVNEPLMRIGDYADTLSKEQAGAQIPTNNGTTVIDVDTTVKPSNIYIEYK